MRSVPRTAVAVLAAASTACAAETTAFPSGRNLLANPGFEDGAAGWQLDTRHRLVEDANAAASGRRCIIGETTGSNQAARLVQAIEVRSNRVYHFRIRARGDPGVKMTLFGVLPGAAARRSLAVWEPIGRRWQTYEAPPIEIAVDGELKLEVISPSSFAAAPGRLWVDDAELVETTPPAVISVSAGKGFNDDPALARAGDGGMFASWLSFRNGDDTVQIARLAPDGERWKPAAQWQVEGGARSRVLGPRLAATDTGAALVYAAEIRGDWEICAVPVTAAGPGTRVVLAGAGADVDPAAAWHGGRLWIAWEASREGRRRICAARVENGRATPAEFLSPPDVNAADPAIAATAAGEITVAWHDFRGGAIDIYARTWSPSRGAWSPERRLTTAPAIDRHAVLVPRGDDLWLLYETAQVREYHVGATTDRNLRLARIGANGLEAPAAGDGPLAAGSEGGAAAWDDDGRLWVAWLRPVRPEKAIGWNVHLAVFDGAGWTEAGIVAPRKGMDRRPGLAVAGGAALVLHQWDNMPHSWTNEAAADLSSSEIELAVVAPPLRPPVPPRMAPLEESAAVFAPLDLRAARGEDTAGWTIEHGGRTYRLFFGDLHEHTDVSPCGRTRDQTIDESYQHMRDLAPHDFACVTDHGYGLNSYLWNYTAKLARANEDPGRFLTFLGEEWTSTFEEYSAAHPYGFYGHRNLIFEDADFPRWWNAKNRQTPAQVWEDLRRLSASFVAIPHQLADTGNVPTDWNFIDPVAQPVAEIFQTRGSYEHDGAPRQAGRTTPKGWFLQDAWARGVVIGVIASPDHGGGYGKACVYATDLSRAAILDALRARRCYGTTAARILLDVRVAGRLMGEAVKAAAPAEVPVEVRVEAPTDIERIDICRNNAFVYSRQVGERQCRVTFVDREPPRDRAWYYARVILKDGEMAWSSPVWWGVP